MRVSPQILGDTLFNYTRLILLCEEYINDTFQLDLSPRCAPCYSNEHIKIAMDGNFNLKKLRTRGAEVQTYPLREESARWPDPKMLEKYNNENLPEKEMCVTQFLEKSRFVAGKGASRSFGSLSPYDVEGVFMGACARHAVPIAFFDIDVGEKFKYALGIIESVLETHGHDIKLDIMYDICCVERFWAYMSAYIPISRPMRACSRRQLFVEASRQYTKEKNQEIGKFLAAKYDDVQDLLQTARSSLDPNKTDDDFKKMWKPYVDSSAMDNPAYAGNSMYQELQGCAAQIRNYLFGMSLRRRQQRKGGPRARSQKRTKTIETSIVRDKKRLVKLVAKYNAIRATHFANDANIRVYADDDAFCDALRNDVHGSSVAGHEVDEAVLAWHFSKRAEEELKLLKEEMRHVSLYTEVLYKKVKEVVGQDEAFGDDSIESGAIAFVKYNYLPEIRMLGGDNFDAMRAHLPFEAVNCFKFESEDHQQRENQEDGDENGNRNEENEDEDEDEDDESLYYPKRVEVVNEIIDDNFLLESQINGAIPLIINP
ncbi:hypothetical protein MBANPS3_011880 [Mucor bainieri]